MWKPFKPPLLKNGSKTVPIESAEYEPGSNDRPTKKRRLIHVIEDSPPRQVPSASSIATNAPRKPLIPVNNTTVIDKDISGSEQGVGYYRVLWRKFTNKKHKTWDGDGFLSVSDGYARLHDVSGREMGKTACVGPLLPGSPLSIGGKDVEVDEVISRKEYLTGRDISSPAVPQIPAAPRVANTPSKPKQISQPIVEKPSKGKIKDGSSVNLTIAAKDFYGSSKGSISRFKTPLISTTVMPKSTDGTPTPRHDPNAPGAVVMRRPKDYPKGKQIVDVVIDPFLGQKLFEHQKEGIKFLYECVMGMRDFNGQGALLADEMGLGKTLQTITLLWTLLKQNPIYGSEPVIKKALIVCPVTLIENWKKEFRRWLGNERIGVFVADDKNTRLTDFTHGKSYSVMIIGYEKLRNVQEELKKGSGIDLVVADEGHRLKTAQNKSAQAIRSLNTPRRIILSGTPLQNDLSEFYVMVDFINPGLLGTFNSFKKDFETPILRSREPGASENDIEKGNDRAEELSSITNMFILRRTADVMSKFLPPKTEYVVFCKPTSVQAQVYRHVLDSPMFGRVLGSSESALQLITILKKVCNAPSLLEQQDNDATPSANVAQLLETMPSDLLRKKLTTSSSKFKLLDLLVQELSSTTSEKVVIVSNYTSTLDLLGNHLTSLGLSFLRLDGSTPSAKRQGLVESFNRSPASKIFAFLLSAKSGGVGINLIGASRLILFDVDWNPATDQQAMARIHRPGQKRPVKIYRFLMGGGMDEKIFQRQVTKTGLADSVVDGKKSEASFSAEELRDLFRLDLEAECQTHDLLGCTCKETDVNPQLRDTISIVAESDEEVIKDSDDSDSDFPENPAMAIMPASKVDMAAQEKKIADAAERKRKKNSKGKMQALMQYSHINTSVFLKENKDIFGFETTEMRAVKAALDDAVLANSLEDEKCKVGFVFAKRG
ncbi:SNF2 family N-terminal domain-containing protein [Xylogone sp. PMI_703]|nr:SNF2 family N-terminal domain-containing protein [Xylogone sp. PMI_703]